MKCFFHNFLFISESSKYRHPVDFIFPDVGQPAEALGFVRNTTYGFSEGGLGFILTSPNTMNLNLEGTVVLRSSNVENGIVQEIFAGGEVSWTNISFTNPEPLITTKKIVNPKISVWRFWIANEDGEIVNSLNGQNLAFSLLFLKEQKPSQTLKKLLKEVQTINDILTDWEKRQKDAEEREDLATEERDLKRKRQELRQLEDLVNVEDVVDPENLEKKSGLVKKTLEEIQKPEEEKKEETNVEELGN